jgi:hypothetical protein
MFFKKAEAVNWIVAGQEVYMTHSGREVKGTVLQHNEFEVSFSRYRYF